MTVKEFYDFVKERNKTDAEMRIVLDSENPFAKGIAVKPYMISIRCEKGKDGEDTKYEVVIG